MKTVSCAACGKKFASSQAVAQHKQAMHGSSQPARNGPKQRKQLVPENPYGVNMMNMAPTSQGRKQLPYNLEKLGSTLAGSEWARRALHPCDETRSGGVKIPDSTDQRTAAVEDRHIAVLSGTDFAAEGKNWDIMLAIIPFPDNPIVYRFRESGTSGWSYWHPLAGLNRTYAPGAMQYVTSGNMNLDVTDQNNSTIPRLVTVPGLSKEVTGFRHTFKGVTVELDANSLSDQGTVVAGQWPQSISSAPKPCWLPGSDFPVHLAEAINGIINQEVEHFIVDDFPDSVDAVLQKCPGSLYDRAKYGVYMPVGFLNAVHPLAKAVASEFEDYTQDADAHYARKCGGIIQMMQPNTDEGAEAGLFGGEIVWTTSPASKTIDGLTATVGVATTTAGPTNMMTGVMLFAGLSRTANLMIKYRQGLEVAPTSKNPLHAAITDAAPMDETATKMVQLVNREVPLALPAKYNNLGLLLPMIGKVASAIAPLVMPWLMRGVSKLTGSSGVPNA